MTSMTRIEELVLELARHPAEARSLRTMGGKNRRARLSALFLGLRRPLSLANPKLEALRLLGVAIHHCAAPPDPKIVADFLRVGWRPTDVDHVLRFMRKQSGMPVDAGR